MSYWSNATNSIVILPDAPYQGYPDWELVDCGCCSGIEWSSGTTPRECRTCGGNGFLARHKKSRMLALYPGGPARGKDS